MELTIVMPCLNESETVEICVKKALKSIGLYGIDGEVVVADNGSTDGSQQIAIAAGARVVLVEDKGYGNALMGGIEAARGKFIIMGDADDSYDFTNLMPFLEKLREGYDLVMGNRFLGGIKPGAMPFLHRYLGNPVLSGMGRLFFRIPIGDFHCGLRGITKAAYERMNLHATGMEFASEMVLKASLLGLRIIEVPTTLSLDGRSRPPHLRTWRDGWRHLRFMLIYSPRWLFLYPGFILIVLGFLGMLWLWPGPQQMFGLSFDIHTFIYAALLIMIGFQAVSFAILSKIYGTNVGLLPENPILNRLFHYFTLEVGLVVGAVLVLLGMAGSIYAVRIWEESSFGPLQPSKTLRTVIPAILMLMLGFQIILSSFMLSILGLRHKGYKLK
jgi:glycosyltransferase involved in cell wall biosynthesis